MNLKTVNIPGAPAKPAKIVQIVPAQNWWVLYFTGDGSAEKEKERVALWALYDDGTVKGLVSNAENGLVPPVADLNHGYAFRAEEIRLKNDD